MRAAHAVLCRVIKNAKSDTVAEFVATLTGDVEEELAPLPAKLHREFQTGVIKIWRHAADWGYIKPDTGDDVYVHRAQTIGNRCFSKGQRVVFVAASPAIGYSNRSAHDCHPISQNDMVAPQYLIPDGAKILQGRHLPCLRKFGCFLKIGTADNCIRPMGRYLVISAADAQTQSPLTDAETQSQLTDIEVQSPLASAIPHSPVDTCCRFDRKRKCDEEEE